MALTLIPNSLIAAVSTNNIAPANAITISPNGVLAADLFCTPTLSTVTLSANDIITSRLKLNNDTSADIFNSTGEFGFGMDTTMTLYGGTFKFNNRTIYSTISFRSIPRAPVTRVVYNFTGANQTFTVPAGVKYVYAKLWGAGGGSGRQGNWTYGSDGGGGGHTRGIIPVTPGETLTLVVGRGGYTTNGVPANRYGGGGGANNANQLYGGDGGGYAGIFGTGGTALTVDVLIVAGGGGGGSDMGGGGGGGGVLEYNNVVITPNVYSITVGAGGAGAAAGANQARGSNGGNSAALGYTAIGGGGGASNHNQSGNPAGNGGSGGGASGGGTLPSGGQGEGGYGGGIRGLGTPGQGFDGSSGIFAWYPGGGGGAGGAGSVNPGNGGPGKISTILGTSYYWGGGGGGSGYSAVGGNGGLGGGGGGAILTTTGGTGGINNGAPGGGGGTGVWAQTPGGSGGANTGGGGGGGSHYNSNNYGGTGGSGIVIIRYLGAQRAYGGNTVSQTTIGGQVYTIHQFTDATTFNFAVDPILIAGGGGGGGSAQSWCEGNVGGAGGGWDGCGGESGFDNKWGFAGIGAGQGSAGYAPSVGGLTIGKAFQGGNSNTVDYGGGGGGGFYGGGGGAYSETTTMGGGGGGSGFVAGSCITGETYKGCRRFPGYFWDEDLEQSIVTGASYGQGICGYGGKNCQNNLPANVPSGGHAKIVIYY